VTHGRVGVDIFEVLLDYRSEGAVNNTYGGEDDEYPCISVLAAYGIGTLKT
jgi:hypothetical protein